MKKLVVFSRIFLGLLGAATLQIAVQALLDPQMVMNNVSVDLGNNLTARNSLRAVYGGVNLFLGVFWVLTAFWGRFREAGLLLSVLYTGGFAFGRVVSVLSDGAPGAFAQQWLVVELVFCALGTLLLVGYWRRTEPAV